MADKNAVTVEGNLTRDAVLIEKEGRVPVSLLRIACNRRRKNRSTGAWEDHPRFFNVKVYGPGAKDASTFVKGQKVLVHEGYLDSYTKGDGSERRDVVSIVAGNTPDGITLVPKTDKQSRSAASEGESVSTAASTPTVTAGGKSGRGRKSTSSRKSTGGKARSAKSKTNS